MKKLLTLLILTLLVSLSSICMAQANPDNYYIRVHPENFKTALLEFSSDRHLDIAGIDRKAQTIDLLVSRSVFNELRERYTIEVLLEPGQMSSDRLDPEYKTPAETEALVMQFHNDFPAITDLVSIGQTLEGREMWALKISDNPAVDEDEPVVLYNGQHHAREVMTVEIMLDAIEYLCTNYGTDPQVTNWVNNLEIWIVPQVNLDGIDYVFSTYYDWRKDRHTPPAGYSDYGIDPNRNYPAFWGACNGSSGTPSSDTYRGQYPGESNCVQNMIDFATIIRPVFDISFHSYSELVIYPYGCDGSYTPDQDALSAVGHTMAGMIETDSGSMGYEPGTCWEILYDTDGGDIDWYYADLGTFAYVIEVNSSSQGFQPSWSWRDGTCLRLRPAWQYLLNRIDGPGITGHIMDACTGTPIENAIVNIQEIPLTADESDRTSDNFGRFFRVLTPGDYHLSVTAPGYSPAIIPFTVGSTRIDQDIQLVPDGSFGLYVTGDIVHDSAGDNDGIIDPGETVGLEVYLSSVGNTTNISADLSSTDPNVTVVTGHAEFGDIADGATGGSQSPHFVISVDAMCPPQHHIMLNLSISADQTLCVDTGEIQKLITNFVYECPIYEETLDSDPGFTIENSGADGWEFGTPSAGPTSGHSGTYCYGTNLDGEYGDGVDHKLISYPFDCSNISNTELTFWRWLANESGYDTAYVEISNDGTTWNPIWSGYANDSDWSEQNFDISEYADGNSQVYLRWRLTSDSSVTRIGFYIDDIMICGDTLPPNIPNLKYSSHDIDDSMGNDDGEINAGETFDLYLTVENKGTDAEGVFGTLSSSNPHVTITTETANFPDIPQNTTATSLTGYRIEISPEADDNEMIPFQLDWHTTQSSGVFYFSDLVVAPTLIFSSVTVMDPVRGDGDGILDPGESAQLVVGLLNSGTGAAHNVSAVLTSDLPAYINITDDTADFSDIAGGMSGVCLTPYFSVTADATIPDHSMVTFTLSITADGYSTSDVFQMEVTSSNFARRYNWNMDSDPGWTTEGSWAYGVPTGSNGDPNTGFTGSNVYGYNLAGAYSNNMPETNLTSLPIDCSNLQNVEVHFMRWLGVESSSYDHASFAVSSDGTTWTTIWEHSGASFTDPDWQAQSFDISSIANGQATVYLRWTMGTTDTSVTYCGWNLDDIEIWAETIGTPPTFTPTPIPTSTPTVEPTPTPTIFVCQNDGDVDNTGSLTPQDALMSFQVYLGIISDPTEEEYCSADCNGNTNVTPEDALCIFQHYLSGSCDCAESLPVTFQTKSAVAANTVYNGQLKVQTVTDRQSGEVIVRILAADSHREINAFGLQIEYSSELLTYSGCEFGKAISNWEATGTHADQGLITVGAFDPFSSFSPQNDTTIAILYFSNNTKANNQEAVQSIQVRNPLDGFSGFKVLEGGLMEIHSQR